MMATKRKQQTVQFLFEASPENNITRCLISTTSNTCGNDEEGNSDDDSFTPITTDRVINQKESQLNAYRNNDEPNSFTHNMSSKRELNVDKESDGDYMKTEKQTDQRHIDKGVLKEHVGSKSAGKRNSNNNEAINVSDDISHGITEASEFKITDNSNQNVCSELHVHRTDQSHEPKIRSTKNTAISDSNNYNNFHNTIQQRLLSNPKDNNSKEQFPVKSCPKHIEVSHEDTESSLTIDGKDKDIEYHIIDHFNAEFYDENESAYLHVIDYDMQEPVSVISSFDYSPNKRQSLKSIGDKREDDFSESCNGFNTTIQETGPNFLQDDNPGKQLPDLGNPRRLQEKQTKPYANIPSNVDSRIENIKFEEDLRGRKQPGNKVKSLIHDYELQVQESSSNHKLDEKQLHLNKNAIQSSYQTERHNTRTNKSLTINVSPLNLEESSLIESSPLHTRELESEKVIYVPSPQASNTPHFPYFNSETPSVIPGSKNLKSLNESQSEDLPPMTTFATKINNTSDFNSLTKKCKTSLLPDSNTDKQSPNAKTTNDFEAKTGNNQSLRSDIKDHQLQAGGSQVTRAHWYDIHSSLPKSLQEIKPAIPKERNTLGPAFREENTFTSPQVMYNLESGETRPKKWKSLEELDNIDHVEEYRLPVTLNKTTAYPVMTNKNNKLDHMYFSTIPQKHEFNSMPRNHVIQNAQKLNLDFDGNSNETLLRNAKTVHRMPFQYNRVPNIHNADNPETIISSFEDNNGQTHKSPDGKNAKQSTSLTRNTNVPNKYHGNIQTNSPGFDISSTRTMSHNTANQSTSLRKYIPTMHNTHGTKKFSSNFENAENTLPQTSNHSLSLTKKRGKLPSYIESLSKVSKDNFNSSETALGTLDKFPVKRSPLPTRKNKKLSRDIQKVDSSRESLLFHEISQDEPNRLKEYNNNHNSSKTALKTSDEFPIKQSPLPTRKNQKQHMQKVDNSSDSLLFHEISQDQENNRLKDYNNNLSSSLTALETLDQSPMKRSQKLKNLVNIEYYDIDSDEELNSKIRRRARTKSLNEADKTTEHVAPRREFKSSGDLRSVGLNGLNQENVNTEKKAREKESIVESSFVSSTRTHGKYTELYMDSMAYGSHSQRKILSNDNPKTDRILSNKPNASIKVSSHDRNLDVAHKSSHVRSTNASNLTTISRQNNSVIKKLPSPLHDISKTDNTMTLNGKYIESNTSKYTVKSKPSPHRNFNSFATNNNNSTKKERNDIKDTTPKPIMYPVEELKASEGKYNIAKAEAEWKKRYGRLPYNKKDPLHKSSDKEFGRLFQQSEKKATTKSRPKETGLTLSSSALQMNDTSSSSLFSPNKIEDDNERRKNGQSKEFSTTLNKLSSYVLSAYKVDQPKTPESNKLENTRTENTVKYKRYYSDDEGDLSHVLDDPNESPKLSMLVHAIVRLREVYNIQPYTKPQTPEHPINLGNPQLRDAIQNKPMSAVKDLILANKSVDINIRSQSGNSALHRAAIEGDIDAVRILINHGANVNTRDRNGFQPVHHALRCHHYKAAIFLMDCGTDLVSYTSKRIQEFVNVKAIAKQYLRQTLKTPL